MRKVTVGFAAVLSALFCLLAARLCWPDTSPDVIRRGKKATALVQTKEAEGTAFCIAASGLFVTNQHVIADAENGKLTLILNAGQADQHTVQATLVRADKEADIALLQAGGTEEFTPLPLGDAENLIETQAVIAFGYPFGSDLAVGKEKYPAISVNVGRITSLRKTEGSLREIQLDAVLNPGNSGGPVVTEKGDVVGIVQSGVRGAGVNFAIPITRLRAFLRKAQATLRPPLLTSGNQRLIQEFGIDLLIAPKPGAAISVTLFLTASGQETREFAAKSAGGSRYSVKAVPIPLPVNVATVRLLTRDATSEGDYVVKNKVVSVGDHACKLSEIKRIVHGSNSYALMVDGQKLPGTVSGLTALEVVGSGGVKINLSQHGDIRVQEASASEGALTYRILAREDGQVICDASGTLTPDAPDTAQNPPAPAESAPAPDEPAEPGLSPAQPVSGRAGMLLIAADEWPTSDTGFMLGSGYQFTQNLGRLFGGNNGGGRFLVYSNHWTYGEAFQTTLRRMGHQVSVSMTPGSLSAYNAVFVGGTPGVDRAALLTYLQHGGNVYIAGSTGMDQERPFWNALLKPFGMEYITHPKDGPIAEPLQIHNFAQVPLFQGVRELHLRGPNPLRIFPGYEKLSQVLSEEDGYNWWVLARVPRLPGSVNVLVPPPAEAAQGGRRIYNWANGHWYEMVTQPGGFTWAEAFADAAWRSHRGMRGHLATITTAQESLFISDHFPNAGRSQCWLGGYQDRRAPDYFEPDGGWRWITGEPWRYTNWHPGPPSQPDNMGGKEDFLQLTGPGTWNDAEGTARVSGYIVEYETGLVK